MKVEVKNDSKVQELFRRGFLNQADLNKKLKPDWYEQGWRYERAVWTEIAEAIGHTNWYWWKHGQYGQPMTPAQMTELHIELADILHFGFSMDLQRARGDWSKLMERAAEYEHAFAEAPRIKCDLGEEMEAIVVDAILLREFNIKKFARVCHQAGLDAGKLMMFYFAKSVLNDFRWKNGYNDKPRTYIKQWPRKEGGTAEDNTIMGEMLHRMFDHFEGDAIVATVLDEAFAPQLFEALERTYREFSPAQAAIANAVHNTPSIHG